MLKIGTDLSRDPIVRIRLFSDGSYRLMNRRAAESLIRDGLAELDCETALDAESCEVR